SQDSLEPVSGEVPPPSVKASNSAETAQALSTARTTTVQRPDGLVVQQVYTPVNQPLTANPAASATSLPTPAPRTTVASAAPVLKVPAAAKVVGVAAPAKHDLSGDRSLVRVFGLKLGKVVIDPGHGGHDTGTIGPNGLIEKDLVLDVAL